jgi:hypothetical protein
VILHSRSLHYANPILPENTKDAGSEVAAAALERQAITAIMNVVRVIATIAYHFGVAVWRVKGTESGLRKYLTIR